MTTWNYADVLEAIADRFPDAPAQLHGGATWSWRDFDERADGVAGALLAAGGAEQDKVAQYLYNGPEYLESVFGAFKAGLVPVNTNYRYGADELVYLWDNADVVAVVFHGCFASTIDPLRPRLPRVGTWLWVDDGSGSCPAWATPYELAATERPGRTRGPWDRTGEHVTLMYTGGTTGAPKGVMWRQHDLIGALEVTNGRPPPTGRTSEVFAERLDKPGPRNLPAAPLMHGTGLFNALAALTIGGSIVTLPGRRFDPVEVLDAIERERVKSLTIVGDAFGQPVVRVLNEQPGRWDLSSLRVVISSGVMWSREVKEGFLSHNDRLILVDALGSSEALGTAASTVTAGPGRSDTASFRMGPGTRILGEDGRDVGWGSGERGLVATRGFLPLGYYKDPDKTAATFRVIDGERYTVTGDWATVDADGTVRLLGRGSQCINTGGEKVYPEEVEEVLKRHPAVADAAVVGVPDERFGEAITAIVQPAPGAVVDAATAEELVRHVKASLAHYKAPRRVLAVPSLDRGANGKLDYNALRQRALAAPPAPPPRPTG